MRRPLCDMDFDVECALACGTSKRRALYFWIFWVLFTKKSSRDKKKELGMLNEELGTEALNQVVGDT